MQGEVAFVDSNVIIAATLPRHPHYGRAHFLLAASTGTILTCGTHSFAEIYNTLTKPMAGYELPSSAVLELLRACRQRFTLITLEPDEVIEVLQTAVALDLRGPIIYEVLLLACARKAQASVIYTFNGKHFRRAAPDLAEIIVEP